MQPNNPYTFDEKYILDFIDNAIYEDVRDGDITGLACIPIHKVDEAILKVKADGILAGVEFAKLVFKTVDPNSTIEIFKNDGEIMTFGEIAFRVKCNTRALLIAERLVLNTMQRMSGIATMSHSYAKEIHDLPVQILDTRKTTPLFRYFEKWAVRIGGCHNYRYGLFDRYMIKDNHTDASGGIIPAIQAVVAHQKTMPTRLPLTVEVRNLDEMNQALSTGYADQIMLDNFPIPLMAEAVKIIDGRVPVEASGGVTMKTLREIALTGVNFISVGALTHSSISLDLSLKVVK
jgi:nicotinate-nucleotide pyrophosphorylase (carboxylating)